MIEKNWQRLKKTKDKKKKKISSTITTITKKYCFYVGRSFCYIRSLSLSLCHYVLSYLTIRICTTNTIWQSNLCSTISFLFKFWILAFLLFNDPPWEQFWPLVLNTSTSLIYLNVLVIFRLFFSLYLDTFVIKILISHSVY